MFFYFNQSGVAIALSLLHPIIFLNNILWTSFHIIKFSSTLWYSDVTGYPWVFCDWGQPLYFISPFKKHPTPKAMPGTVYFTEDFVSHGGETYIVHHPVDTLEHPNWSSVLSTTRLSCPAPQPLKTTTSSSGSLVCAMPQDGSQWHSPRTSPGD